MDVSSAASIQKANYVSEVYWPKFSDRRTYGTWEKDERNNDIRKRVRIKIEEMLNQYSYSLGLEKRSGTGQNYNKV